MVRSARYPLRTELALGPTLIAAAAQCMPERVVPVMRLIAGARSASKRLRCFDPHLAVATVVVVGGADGTLGTELALDGTSVATTDGGRAGCAIAEMSGIPVADVA